MALIKTIDEIKAVLPKFLSNTTAPSALPNFDQAEYKYLVPIVGVDLYNDIQAKYNAVPQTLTDDDKVLLKKMQLVEASNAFLDELGLGQLVLTENGFKKLAKEQTYRWEYEKLEDSLKTIAADGTEVLFNYLLEKKPVLWTSSDAYKQFNKLLIKTGTEFSSYYTLNQPNRTFFFIRSKILDAQKLYLTPAIGKDLLKYLIELTAPSDNLNENSIAPLKSALAFFAIKQSCGHYSVRFSDAGFTVLQAGSNDSAGDAGRTNAPGADIQAKIDACEKDGNTYLSEAKDELVKYYQSVDAEADFKTAFEKGPLLNYVTRSERTSGNEKRKGVFRL